MVNGFVSKPDSLFLNSPAKDSLFSSGKYYFEKKTRVITHESDKNFASLANASANLSARI